MTSQNRESGLTAIASGVARFHLHARQAPAVLDEKVVGVAVAVGFGDTDAFACCAVHECELGKLTHSFGAEVPGGHVVFWFFQLDSPWCVVASGRWLVVKKEKAQRESAPFDFAQSAPALSLILMGFWVALRFRALRFMLPDLPALAAEVNHPAQIQARRNCKHILQTF